MDPNQNQVQNINQPTPQQSPKFLLPLLVLFVLLFISALVIFFAKQTSPVTTSGRAVSPPTHSPISIITKPAGSEEEQELNAIDLGDIDKDLQDIQTDVDQL